MGIKIERESIYTIGWQGRLDLSYLSYQQFECSSAAVDKRCWIFFSREGGRGKAGRCVCVCDGYGIGELARSEGRSKECGMGMIGKHTNEWKA